MSPAPIRIEHVALWTRNVEALRDFYVRWFGAEPNDGYENAKKQFRSYFLGFGSGARIEVTSQRFVEFIKKLRADAGRPIIVIADNAKYHKEGPVKHYLKPTGEGIHVAHLPTYSPELNPDEQVWNHLKRRLGKMFLESKEHLKNQVRKTMLSIQRSISLVLSFFELEDTRYAADAK